MLHKARRVASIGRVWLCLVFCFVSFCQSASSAQSDGEAAYAQAFEFMRTYYQQVNLEKALNLTTADARQVVSQAIQERTGSGVSRDAVPPSVDFRRHMVKEVEGSFVMVWSVLSGAGFSLTVTTRSVRTAAGWKVSSFVESQDK